MLFPVSDERDHVRPTDAQDPDAEPRITAWHVLGMAILAMLGMAGGFGLAHLYFYAVAAESRDHDARLRADILKEVRQTQPAPKAP